MKVNIDGKEIILADNLEPGTIELDTITEEDDIDLENTIELTAEILEALNEKDD